MKNLLLSTTAALAFAASAVYADTIAEQVISQLQAEGYERIEISSSSSRVEVEAIRDGMKLEVTYDAVTGEILEQEVRPVNDSDDTTPGIEIDGQDDDSSDDDEDENDDDDSDDDDEDDDENDDDDEDEDEDDDSDDSDDGDDGDDD